MFILILFSFLGGVVTILSPCILPILPIVLSGSLTGSKHRPYGIVTGFILSFAFFTLFLTAIVRASGISPDILRTISVVIIALFGLTLLIPQFQTTMEKLFSTLAGIAAQKSSAQHTNHSDYISGILIGVSLGLIWTPCVGPILASIITLAATSSITFNVVLITLAYSVGTAIPLLIITYGGRRILQKSPWLLHYSSTIQKSFGVLMIVTAMLIYFQIDRKFQIFILDQFPNYGVGLTKIEDTNIVRDALSKIQNKPIDEKIIGKPMPSTNSSFMIAPEFIPGSNWFNTEDFSPELTMNNLRGRVVLVDFWTYTCINCIRTLPYLKSWHTKYKDKGLTIVGVHTPEFEFEKNPINVAKAIKDFDIEYPVMQDNNYMTWTAYRNRYWPAKYLIDKNGFIRYTHFGEGAYDETEKMIQRLIAETGADATAVIENPDYAVHSQTPELYLGYQRIQYFSSIEGVRRDVSTSYSIPNQIPSNSFAYGGAWIVGSEQAIPAKGSILVLSFNAQEVFLVMRPRSSDDAIGKIRVLLDGQAVGNLNAGADVSDGLIQVDSDRLYKLIKLHNPGPHLLQLEFLNDSVELYAFTFG